MGWTKEQAREYNVQRRNERRNYCINKLGGKCVKCGSVKKLQFDHVKPIGQVRGRRISELLTCSLERLEKELINCQLLCKDCHKIKTVREDRIHADQTHGTLSSYRWCKCSICKEAKNMYMRNYLPKYRQLYGR